METIVVATNNENKLREIRQIVKDAPYIIRSMKQTGIALDVKETGSTFEENALLKARALYKITGTMTIADDSGLVTDALDGAPGIYSARYAGMNATDAQNNEKLLKSLADVPDEQRSARFVCVIAVVKKDGTYFTVQGTLEGFITREPRGTNGFGYDPLFYIPSLGKTAAQLTQDEKNGISHRARALAKMVQRLTHDL